jgi:hypothetical protein
MARLVLAVMQAARHGQLQKQNCILPSYPPVLAQHVFPGQLPMAAYSLLDLLGEVITFVHGKAQERSTSCKRF